MSPANAYASHMGRGKRTNHIRHMTTCTKRKLETKGLTLVDSSALVSPFSFLTPTIRE